VPTRFIILRILLPAIVLGVGSVQQSMAQNPSVGGNSNAPFVMPKVVDPPPFDPIKAASFIEDFGWDAEESGTTGLLGKPLLVPAELPLLTAQATSVSPELLDPAPESVYQPQNSPDVFFADDLAWTWQVLPDGLLYKSYMAGTRESRLSAALMHDTKRGWVLDSVLGGRAGILRFGSPTATGAEGWQLDAEAAAFLRMNPEEGWDVDSADFRFGFPLTYRRGAWQWKTGYYHLSSHVGDEFLVRNPGFQRINYVRDSLFVGLGYFPIEDLRLYGEIGWAMKTDGGAEPLEFQLGADYSPACTNGLRGAPFAAVNVHLREEVDFGGGVNVMAGWQWRGPLSNSTFRAGIRYYNGKTTQYAFFNRNEELIGFGFWYDY